MYILAYVGTLSMVIISNNLIPYYIFKIQNQGKNNSLIVQHNIE